MLDAATIDRLRCRIVAGAANNQLATPEDAARLRARGIVYVPDFVLNSGGALYVVGVEALGWTPTEAEAQVRRIGDTVRRVLALSDAEGITSELAAQQLAAHHLSQAQPLASDVSVASNAANN